MDRNRLGEAEKQAPSALAVFFIKLTKKEGER
jgi:hypothetical protein